MSTITVFTPTYNRAKTLGRTYESLLRQTSKDFEWLIVDDGSVDETRELVQKWIGEDRLKISYFHKENGGLHTGYNVAIQNIHTELCICCDSDDFLSDNAIEIILDTWREKGSKEFAGIIGLDFIAYTDTPIGGYFKKELESVHILDVPSRLGHEGDVKLVLRTELLKPFVPMPSFGNEKNFNPIYLFLKINPELEYIVLNENLCFVDYQSSGMSANILNQFKNSPRSFAELRKVKIIHPRVPLFRKYIDAAHLCACALIARDKNIIWQAPRKWFVLSAFPLGFGFYAYINMKTKK